MKFRISDNKESDVLGGPISEDNAFLMYGVCEKKPVEMAIGETQNISFNMCGQGIHYYRLLRVE